MSGLKYTRYRNIALK